MRKNAGLAGDRDTNTAQDMLIGALPMGTTLSTAFGKRPEGHSRATEWAARVGGSALGGTVGAGIGGLIGKGTGSRVGLLAGLLGGEGIGSHLATKDYYDAREQEKKGSAMFYEGFEKQASITGLLGTVADKAKEIAKPLVRKAGAGISAVGNKMSKVGLPPPAVKQPGMGRQVAQGLKSKSPFASMNNPTWGSKSNASDLFNRSKGG